MEFVTVQGERVSALGFGTWRLSGTECHDAVEDALALGYRHIDTAQAYGNEEQVGAGIRSSGVDRGDIFLTTKIMPEDQSRDRLLRAADQSLKRLRVDYLDLLLLHWPNFDVPLEETMESLAELQSRGKTRHVGLSNFTPTMVERANRTTRVFSNQVEYHPYLAQPKLTRQAVELDYLLTAYAPVARGKVSNDPVLQDIAAACGKTPGQVALRWLIQQDHVAAIPKAASADHRRGNLEIFDFSLTDEQMQRIFDLGGEHRLIDPDWAPAWER